LTAFRPQQQKDAAMLRPSPLHQPSLQEQIIAAPELVLDDLDVMQALLAANDRIQGPKVVDLRSRVVQRLENQLEQLEDTHRSVVSAAYDNLAGTNMVHRALLAVMEHDRLEDMLLALNSDIAHMLRIDCIRLLLESAEPGTQVMLARLQPVLHLVPQGFLAAYLDIEHPRGARHLEQSVTLRPSPLPPPPHYRGSDYPVLSEAVMRIDLGPGRLPGVLLFGSSDPQHFRAVQGTELLAFFGAAFERVLKRWLR